MLSFSSYERYRLQIKNICKLNLSSIYFLYQILNSIFRYIETDVISGTGSHFFDLTTVPRSAFLDPVYKIHQFWKLDMKIDILNLVTLVLEFWISTERSELGQSKHGTYFVAKFYEVKCSYLGKLSIKFNKTFKILKSLVPWRKKIKKMSKKYSAHAQWQHAYWAIFSVICQFSKARNSMSF